MIHFFINWNALLPVLNSKINDPIISKINIIANKTLNLKEYEKELGFWEIINKYNLDIIGIFKPNNNPRLLDSIASLYKFLDKMEDFFILIY